MKIQLEQLDLLKPWPQITMRPGYHAVRVLAYVGTAPLGEVMCRPARRGVVAHRGLRKRLARKHAVPLLRMLVREGLAAGPEALRAFPPDAKSDDLMLSLSKPKRTAAFVEREVLSAEGMPAPYRQWAIDGQSAADFPLPPVTVVVCTRDRPAVLAGCIENLKRLDYPAFEILVVDNSRDPVPTRRVVEEAGDSVSYMREPVAGLSRARNAGLSACTTRWAAFTDDDCKPEPNWLRELVRPLQDTKCVCVTGLVLPATLDNAAEITFEVYGGLGRGYQSRVFDRGAIGRSRIAPVQTWRAGAGANMLIDAPLTRELGAYDEDMGPGGVGGCGEDTDVFYKFLRGDQTIHYAPRAIVHHHHRSSPEALRAQVYSYAKGHAAYHWRCFWMYRDYRSMIHLLFLLPRWFVRNLRLGMAAKTRYPFTLVFLEIRGTLVGPVQYTIAKARRALGSMMGWASGRRRRVTGPVPADPVVPQSSASYDAVDRNKSVRVA